MKIEIENKSYIVNEEGIYKREIKAAMFLSVYFCFNLLFFVIYVIRILQGDADFTVVGGSIHVYCLFLSAIWIEELLNEH